jgi:hypothetical protein
MLAISSTAKLKSDCPDSGFQTAEPSRTTTRSPSAAMRTAVSDCPSGN